TGDNATITAYASPFPTKPYGLCGDPENKDGFKPTSVRIQKNKQQPNGICSFLLCETVFVICLLQNCADAILHREEIYSKNRTPKIRLFISTFNIMQ
ncbi:MAG: hypothetical protein SPH20_03625, partial [Eubacterium sp.]|nr:hypothetical protein [Eubacterium sp.]